MKTKDRYNKQLRIRLNNVMFNRLKKRAKDIDIEVSTYIRTLIHLDTNFCLFENMLSELNIDTELLKKIDDKVFLVSDKQKKEDNRIKNLLPDAKKLRL